MMFRGLSRVLWLAVVGGIGWLAAQMARAGAVGLGILFVLAGLSAAWIYNSRRTHAARYLLPGLATFAIFVLLPLLYTVHIAFTNLSGEHLLRQDQVRAWFAQDLHTPDPAYYAFRLHPAAQPGQYQVVVPVGRGEIGRNLLISRPFTTAEAQAGQPVTLGLNTLPPTAPALGIREIIAARPWLNHARFSAPGQSVPLRPVSLRALGYRVPRWREEGAALVNVVTGQTLQPDAKRGNYVDVATGEAVGPGWHVWIGTENFRQIFRDPAIRAPFFQIFGWNIAFALLSVTLTFMLGVALASLLQWPALRGRNLYRTLLILPYAIPAFIPILVFKGLFNEGYGEINHLLQAWWGIAPKWFTNPWLARLMILLVNTWLGYPYMMIIASGMLQAIPDDMYEATAMDGAGPWTNFSRITLPQIFPPLFPLLIASFAFNFNNFTLIYLLTGGKPDIVGSATVAGTTDLLVSYTFRMAFKDSSARFGFAAAVATLLFVVVAGLAWWQLRVSRPRPATPGGRA